MTRAVFVGVAVLSFGLACSEKGRSLVLVDLIADGTLDAASVAVIVTQRGARIGGRDRAGSTPWQLGVYLDKHVTGSVNVIGCAFDEAGTVLAAGMPASEVMVHPGERTGPAQVAGRQNKTSRAR